MARLDGLTRGTGSESKERSEAKVWTGMSKPKTVGEVYHISQDLRQQEQQRDLAKQWIGRWLGQRLGCNVSLDDGWDVGLDDGWDFGLENDVILGITRSRNLESDAVDATDRDNELVPRNFYERECEHVV